MEQHRNNNNLYKNTDYPVTPDIVVLQERISNITQVLLNSELYTDDVYSIINKAPSYLELYERIVLNTPANIQKQLAENKAIIERRIKIAQRRLSEESNELSASYKKLQRYIEQKTKQLQDLDDNFYASKAQQYVTDIQAFQEMFLGMNVNKLLEYNTPEWILYNKYRWYIDSIGIRPEFLGEKLIDGPALDINDIGKEFRAAQTEDMHAVNNWTEALIHDVIIKPPEELAKHLVYVGGGQGIQLSKIQRTAGIANGSPYFDKYGRLLPDTIKRLSDAGIAARVIPEWDLFIMFIKKTDVPGGNPKVGFLKPNGVQTLNGVELPRRIYPNIHIQVEGYNIVEQTAENIKGNPFGYSQGDIINGSFINTLFGGNSATGWPGLVNLPDSTGSTVLKNVDKTRNVNIYTLSDDLGGWSNEDLLSEFYFPSNRFNEMLLGDYKFNAQFGVTRKSDPLLAGWDRLQNLSMANSTRAELTFDILNDSTNTNPAKTRTFWNPETNSYEKTYPGALGRFTNQQLYDYMLKHPEYTLVVHYARLELLLQRRCNKALAAIAAVIGHDMEVGAGGFQFVNQYE